MNLDNKNSLNGTSQAGSLMIEAMAMLALISLVTPTLYKKSAERTTELQDINTATHLRTMIKAVDNYVATNYKALVENDTIPDKGHKRYCKNPDDNNCDGDLSKFKEFLPYGFDIAGNFKNFEAPKIILHREGNTVTSYVELPRSVEIGAMRAARIASMIGSNGGYVEGAGNDRTIKGVGGIWGVDKGEFSNNGFSSSAGSVVAASSEAISAATSIGLDNDKYLQRIKDPDSDDEIWRNTMETDLYMGGVTGQAGGKDPAKLQEMHGIYGVNQLIVGATEDPTISDGSSMANPADVIVLGASNGGYGWSNANAWIGGSLSALNESFKTYETSSNGGRHAILTFGKYDNKFEVYSSYNMYTNTYPMGMHLTSRTEGQVFFADEATFSAGPHGGAFINGYYEGSSRGANVSIGERIYMSYGDRAQGHTAINSHVRIRGAQGIAAGHGLEYNIVPDFDPALLPEKMVLEIDGNTYNKGTLASDVIETPKFKALTIAAGAKDFTTTEDQMRFYTSDEDGTMIRANVSRQKQDILKITDDEAYFKKTVAGVTTGIELKDEMGPRTYIDGGFRLVFDTYDGAGLPSAQRISMNPDHRSYSAMEIQGKGDNASIDMKARDITATTVDGLTTFQIHNDPSINQTRLESYASYNTFMPLIPNGYVQVLNSDGMEKFVITPNEQGGGVRSYATYNEIHLKEPHVGHFEVVSASGYGSYGLLEVAEDYQTTSRSAARLARHRFSLNSLGNYTDRPILDVDMEYRTDYQYPSKDTGLPGKNGKGSVYIREGAIELRTNASDFQGDYADGGFGYISGSRFVANNVYYDGDHTFNDNDVIKPIFAGEYETNGNYYNYKTRKPYDRYMVNPAYTSVMHDIKLTTRGGARLSDILPDFINKGIYVVNNSIREGAISSITGSVNFIDVYGNSNNTATSSNDWASPFMGIVPAPQCPPGYARVFTITPASFQMAQAGSLEKHNNRYYVYEGQGLSELPKGQWSAFDNTGLSTSEGGPLKYVVSYTENDKHRPKPIYVQQSTWLKTAGLPVNGDGGRCNATTGRQCGNDFKGWAAIMGFLYPTALYDSTIKSLDLENLGQQEEDAYWNIFPVRAMTLEAYATVYCYFDRTNMYDSSGHNDKMVDQYDLLKQPRSGYGKYGKKSGGNYNSYYLNRLEDPTLTYHDPW